MSFTKKFFQAVDECSIEEVRELSSKVTKDSLNRALSIVCGTGNIELVKVLLQQGADDIYNAFPEATYSGSMELVHLLLGNTTDVDYNYALQTSSLSNNRDMFEFVLARLKAAGEVPPFDLCLAQAAQGYHKEMVLYLTREHGARDFNMAIEWVEDDISDENKKEAYDMIEWLKHYQIFLLE